MRSHDLRIDLQFRSSKIVPSPWRFEIEDKSQILGKVALREEEGENPEKFGDHGSGDSSLRRSWILDFPGSSTLSNCIRNPINRLRPQV